MSEVFDDICDVEDLDDHMRIEMMYSLGHRDQTLTLALNDLYFIHHLVFNYRHEVGREGVCVTCVCDVCVCVTCVRDVCV